MLNQGLVKLDYRTAPGITAAVLSNGVVLMYAAPSAASTFAYSLPWLITNVNPNVIVSYIPTVGRLVIYNTQVNSVAGGFVLNAAYVYRYVIIPGGVSGGRTSGLGGTNYTANELRQMSYQQICNIFNIPATGEGWK
jgi:hypothetical protein